MDLKDVLQLESELLSPRQYELCYFQRDTLDPGFVTTLFGKPGKPENRKLTESGAYKVQSLPLATLNSDQPVLPLTIVGEASEEDYIEYMQQVTAGMKENTSGIEQRSIPRSGGMLFEDDNTVVYLDSKVTIDTSQHSEWFGSSRRLPKTDDRGRNIYIFTPHVQCQSRQEIIVRNDKPIYPPVVDLRTMVGVREAGSQKKHPTSRDEMEVIAGTLPSEKAAFLRSAYKEYEQTKALFETDKSRAKDIAWGKYMAGERVDRGNVKGDSPEYLWSEHRNPDSMVEVFLREFEDNEQLRAEFPKEQLIGPHQDTLNRYMGEFIADTARYYGDEHSRNTAIFFNRKELERELEAKHIQKTSFKGIEYLVKVPTRGMFRDLEFGMLPRPIRLDTGVIAYPGIKFVPREVVSDNDMPPFRMRAMNDNVEYDISPDPYFELMYFPSKKEARDELEKLKQQGHNSFQNDIVEPLEAMINVAFEETPLDVKDAEFQLRLPELTVEERLAYVNDHMEQATSRLAQLQRIQQLVAEAARTATYIDHNVSTRLDEALQRLQKAELYAKKAREAVGNETSFGRSIIHLNNLISESITEAEVAQALETAKEKKAETDAKRDEIRREQEEYQKKQAVSENKDTEKKPEPSRSRVDIITSNIEKLQEKDEDGLVKAIQKLEEKNKTNKTNITYCVALCLLGARSSKQFDKERGRRAAKILREKIEDDWDLYDILDPVIEIMESIQS